MERKYESLDAIIARLQEFRDKFGNIPVRCRLPGALRKIPLIGIQSSKDETAVAGAKQRVVDIIPQYDAEGLMTEKGGVNTIAREIADIFAMFRDVARSLISVKAMISNDQKCFKETSNTSLVLSKFNKIYDSATKIKDLLVGLKGFDARLRDVVKECIAEDDYCVSYAHHIDINMSDAEFAKAVTDGVGSKTSVQRMSIFLDVIDKINKEINTRMHRITALERRIAEDKDSNESNNAKILIKKSYHIIETLKKRREYMSDRFTALKDSVLSNIERMEKDLQDLMKGGLHD